MSEKIDILLIEDEPNIAEAVRFILTRSGWRVGTMWDGLGAMAAIRADRPRLVILDLMLPGRSGHEILTDLRADPDRNLAGTLVLLLTAQGQAAQTQAAQSALQPGQRGICADAVLSKPFANDDLRALVQRLLG